MKVIRDPTVPGDLDVSACFDNAKALNTSLSTGAVIAGQSVSNDNYYRFTDQLARASTGQWQVISNYPIVYYRGPRSASRETLPYCHAPRYFRRARCLRGRGPVPPAGAADGSSSVNCSTGSSCEIMLEHMIHFGGKNYSPGAENTVVDITPPPCLWIPQGDAHAGSQVVIDFYNNTDPGPGALFDGEHAFTEAKQLVNQNPIPAGTWYELPVNPNDTQAQVQQCLNEPLFFWDVPGQALPGIEIPPRTLAQLALAKMNIPQAGRMILSPTTGNSYSNLPTFARTTLSFRPEFGPGGMPYVTDNAQLGAQSATVWVRATPLQLSTSDNSARLDTACLRLPRLERDGHQPGRRGPHRRQRHRRLRRHLPPARDLEHHRHADLAGLLGGRHR